MLRKSILRRLTGAGTSLLFTTGILMLIGIVFTQSIPSFEAYILFWIYAFPIIYVYGTISSIIIDFITYKWNITDRKKICFWYIGFGSIFIIVPYFLSIIQGGEILSLEMLIYLGLSSASAYFFFLGIYYLNEKPWSKLVAFGPILIVVGIILFFMNYK